MRFLSRVFMKPTQISLAREGQSFLLRFLYDNRASSCAEVVEKWPELAALARFVENANASVNEIRVSDLTALRTAMETLRRQCEGQKKLIFYIPSDVARIEVREEAPEGFLVRYVPSGNSLVRILPPGAVELEDGWLRLGDSYWRFGGLDERHVAGLRRDSIDSSSILSFLREDLKVYSGAGVPLRCELAYAEEAAVTLQISNVTPTSIELRPDWRVRIEEIDETFTLPDHVLVRGAIRPGLLPAALRQLLPDPVRPTTLEGESVARFLDAFYLPWKRHLAGDLRGFEAVHRWIVPPYRWILIARAREIRGIGRAYGHPCARIGNEEFSAEQVREMLQRPYARIAAGWVRGRDLRTLGMDANGAMPDGKPLKPVRLDAELLLHRGGKRLDGLFSEMRLDGARWRDSGDKHSCVKDHLAFLMHWGINGGVTGGYEAMVAYGLPLLRGFCAGNRDAAVLVAGSSEDCGALSALSAFFGRLFDGERVRLIPYDDLLSDAGRALDQRWDLACLIEPDDRSIAASVKRYQAMLSIRAACKIGFFLRGDSGDAQWQGRASALLGYRDAELTLRLIRDGRAPKALFEPHRFPEAPARQPAEGAKSPAPGPAPARPARAELPREDRGAEIDLGGAARPGVPIPPRRAGLDPLGIVTVSAPDPQGDFFREARRCAGLEGVESPRVPFLCYWPKYADMNADQRKWYFWLRTQLRRGEHPETDLSYLFIFVYELLNQIGTESPAQGLKLLKQVWRDYGGAYPQLNFYLEDWVFDYIRVYGLKTPAGDFLWEVPSLSNLGLDVLLTEMAERKDALRLPIWALEKLSLYRVTSSKFYQRGNQDLVDAVLPEVVEAVDRALRKKSGKGILETYAPLKLRSESRTAFVGALCESPRSYPLKYWNYTAGLKLRGLLRNLVRYAENALRAQRRFSAKLQGIELPEQFKAWADAALKAKLAEPEAPASQAAPAQIVLDLGSVERLRAESDQVRATLLASVGNAPAVISIIKCKKTEVDGIGGD